MDKIEVFERIGKDNVKFVSFQFTDVTGAVKSVDAPVSQLEHALDEGIWFDGSSVEGFARIQESDMHLLVDSDSYAALPWSPPELQRARFFCDIYQPNGDPFLGDPRGLLKRTVKKLKEERGWLYNVGPEPEFFLFRRNGGDSTHPVPHDIGSYFDFSPDDEAVQVRTELMQALLSMGLEIEVGHHEVALGQHEIDFRFADAVKTADNVLTLKYTVKAIAAKHGLIASFMPKPVFGINGSGMHCHQSLFNTNGDNIFYDANDPRNLSDIAKHFIAGQLSHAKGMTCLTAPTVNSYKRLVPGYEAPVYIGWAQTNRSALIRIPRVKPGQEKGTRAELRSPDPSSNPYLAFTAILCAGLDGIDKKMVCPEPLQNVNVYNLTDEERISMGIDSLPGSLIEAIHEMDKDPVMIAAVGDAIYDAFKRAKNNEWEEYRLMVSDWELKRFLEAA